MNRFDLLSECRETILVPQDGALERSYSAEKEDKQFMSSSLQLRDLRILQGVRGPAIFVRRGAFVVSLDPLHAVITRVKAFVIIPEENTDAIMQSLLTRYCQENAGRMFETSTMGPARRALLAGEWWCMLSSTSRTARLGQRLYQRTLRAV